MKFSKQCSRGGGNMCDMCGSRRRRNVFLRQFYYQSRILFNLPSPSASHSTSWCYSTPDLEFALFLTILVCVFYSFYTFLKSVFVLCLFFCVSISCLLLCLIFSLPHLFSLLSFWHCVLLASFQLCSSICPHSLLQGFPWAALFFLNY